MGFGFVLDIVGKFLVLALFPIAYSLCAVCVVAVLGMAHHCLCQPLRMLFEQSSLSNNRRHRMSWRPNQLDDPFNGRSGLVMPGWSHMIAGRVFSKHAYLLRLASLAQLKYPLRAAFLNRLEMSTAMIARMMTCDLLSRCLSFISFPTAARGEDMAWIGTARVNTSRSLPRLDFTDTTDSFGRSASIRGIIKNADRIALDCFLESKFDQILQVSFCVNRNLFVSF